MSEIKLKSQKEHTTKNEELNQLLEVYDAYDRNKDSDKPFYTVQDEQIAVIGDANDTEVVTSDYTVGFLFDKDELDEIPEDAEIVGNFVRVEQTYEKVRLNPKKFPKVLDDTLAIQPFLVAVEELTDEMSDDANDDEKELYGMKLNKIYSELRDETIDACYGVVKNLLGIDDELADHMQPYSVLVNIMKIISLHPELFNSANVLFG